MFCLIDVNAMTVSSPIECQDTHLLTEELACWTILSSFKPMCLEK